MITCHDSTVEPVPDIPEHPEGVLGRCRVVWARYGRVMSDHCIFMIDAGYLLAASATKSTGSSMRRGINVDYAHLLAGLLQAAEQDCGLPALRAVWYDAARGGQPTEEHRQIGRLPSTKIRIGRISAVTGEQKGVDLRLALDLIGISRADRVEVIYLISGDDDLAEAVEQAQEQGVKVVLLGVPAATTRTGVSSASDNLVITVDRVLAIPDKVLQDSIIAVTAPQPGISAEHSPATLESPALPTETGSAATERETGSSFPTPAPRAHAATAPPHPTSPQPTCISDITKQATGG